MMTSSTLSISYAGQPIPFRLIYSRRKTMEIAVHPDGLVCVRAPLGEDEARIRQRVHKRAAWIHRQLHHFAQFAPRTPPRRFVSGESHRYLGRQYRLRVTPCATEGVVLKRGFFQVAAVDAAPARVERLLAAWYRQRAGAYFARMLDECWLEHRFQERGASRPALKVRSMKTRWGSLSRRGIVTLNLELIKAPRQCIEYVVVHELCHLLHPNHGKGFHQLQERCLPDWQKRKRLLEMACL